LLFAGQGFVEFRDFRLVFRLFDFQRVGGSAFLFQGGVDVGNAPLFLRDGLIDTLNFRPVFDFLNFQRVDGLRLLFQGDFGFGETGLFLRDCDVKTLNFRRVRLRPLLRGLYGGGCGVKFLRRFREAFVGLAVFFLQLLDFR